MVFSGDRTPDASGQTRSGPGSRRGNLVPRGPRFAASARRGVTSRFAGGSSSGAEASSEPLDDGRSRGRGAEEATGLPRPGTPGNPGRPFIHTVSEFKAVAVFLSQ